MRRFVSLAIILTLALPVSAQADPDDRHKGRHDRGEEFRRGGPPPWAPAHGWRRKHQHQSSSYEYSGLPPFLRNGRCDRNGLADMLAGALGGIAGGLGGTQIGQGDGRVAAIIGGTLLGVLVGGQMGRMLDPLDQNCIGQALEHMPSGQEVAWRNPDNGSTMRATPVATFNDGAGRYCREYTTTITIGGQRQSAYGTACRQPDGSWQRL